MSKSPDVEQLALSSHVESPRPVAQWDAQINALTPKEQGQTMRKVDLRLTLTLGVIYCFNLLDRTNISLATVAGMKKDLHLDIGTRYSVMVLVRTIVPPACFIF